MAKMKGVVVVNTDRCKGCSLCVVACPLHVLALTPKVNPRGYNYVQQVLDDTCIGCASCAIVCPDACLTVYRAQADNMETEHA
ncbi:MAG: 4Fe-4S binding protein [Bacteroidales bacterium]|nr:4Fe-4S binding protein [Bacteroidales bacterium]